MGTVVSFSLREAESATDARRRRWPRRSAAARAVAEAALERAEAKLRWVDDVFSTWKPQSPVSRLRRGEIELDAAPPEVAEVLELCRKAQRRLGRLVRPVAPARRAGPDGSRQGLGRRAGAGRVQERRRAGRADQRRRRHRRLRAAGARPALADRHPPSAGRGPAAAQGRAGRPRRRSPPPAPTSAASTSSTRTRASRPTGCCRRPSSAST